MGRCTREEAVTRVSKASDEWKTHTLHLTLVRAELITKPRLRGGEGGGVRMHEPGNDTGSLPTPSPESSEAAQAGPCSLSSLRRLLKSF